ncbi:MAG: DinB family protein [Candidatus Thorarchaeota archaeon]|nr:DinB family protein [Candidatus Thorarchaeota archaeon]
MTAKINEGLHHQFQSSCTMLKDAIKNVPDEKWHKGTESWFFSLTAYHIVETMDFYTRDSPKGMKWGAKAGYDWDSTKDIETDILPKISKDIVTAYIKEMEERLKTFFETKTPDQLSSDDDFEWFTSIFERILYLLRHNMHHIGELCKTLRDWKCERAKWT